MQEQMRKKQSQMCINVGVGFKLPLPHTLIPTVVVGGSGGGFEGGDEKDTVTLDAPPYNDRNV